MALRDQLKAEAEESKKMKLDVQRSLAEREVLEKNIKTKHLFLRAWIGYFLSLFLKDRGTIPTNIGTSLHVLSNMYITKDHLSSLIEICEFGGYVPMYVIGHIKTVLRRRGNNAKVPWSFINAPYHINQKDGLDERIRAWEHTVDPNAKFTRTERERAARQLYTVDLFKQGKTLMNTRVVLHVHASKASELDAALNIIYAELTRMGVTYELKTYKMFDALKGCSMLATQTQKGGMTILTNAHIAQMVPNFGGENDKKGVFFGINKLANVPYRIDFSTITQARNIYVAAPSGVGKTVITVNAIQSAIEQGYRLCIMDIKGNEYDVLVKSVGGKIVSLRINSRGFINSWVLHAEDVDASNPIMVENYFKDRLQFTKEQIVTLSGLKDENDLLNLKSLLDEFINDYYMNLGITMDNVKSWKASEKLTPFDMWEVFETYYPSKLKHYHIANSTIVTLRMYFTKEGTKSYIFADSMDYNSIINSPAISFDFGLLSSGSGDDASGIDMNVLRLKFVYMQRINRDFTSRNYAQDVRTLKVLEESQIVSDEIMHIYAREYTLGRSQKQDTILLGNSIAALEHSATASALLENTTCLLVSKLNDNPLNFLIKQFNLESYRPLLALTGSEAQYNNCFAVINRMQTHAMPGLVRVEMPKGPDGKPIKYKVNIPTKEGLYGK